jgi:hypothetical protein
MCTITEKVNPSFVYLPEPLLHMIPANITLASKMIKNQNKNKTPDLPLLYIQNAQEVKPMIGRLADFRECSNCLALTTMI